MLGDTADLGSKSTLRITSREMRTNSIIDIEVENLTEMWWFDLSPSSWSWKDRRTS